MLHKLVATASTSPQHVTLALLLLLLLTTISVRHDKSSCNAFTSSPPSLRLYHARSLLVQSPVSLSQPQRSRRYQGRNIITHNTIRNERQERIFRQLPLHSTTLNSANATTATTTRTPPPLPNPTASITTSGGSSGSSTATKGPLSMTIEELSTSLQGRGRAKATWDCYRRGINPVAYFSRTPTATTITPPPLESEMSWEEMYALMPPARRTQGLGGASVALLEEMGGGIEGVVGDISEVSVSADGTAKLLVRLASDGLEVETVIIPWVERSSSTLCISSQVGCRMGCTFCATGRMGKLRSLSSDEILSQVYFANKVCRLKDIPTIDNIVFMGMGEPADNAPAVTLAAKILTDTNLFSLAQTKTTISTVGPTPQCFSTLATAPCALAWSVHAARDDLRRQLVPTTKYSMSELRDGFISALRDRPKRLKTSMLEVVLVDGVNDNEREALELVEFAKVMIEEVEGIKLVVNLIPFNDIGNVSFGTPSRERVSAFQEILIQNGIYTFVRTTRGDDEMAACGQLATKKQKKKKIVVEEGRGI